MIQHRKLALSLLIGMASCTDPPPLGVAIPFRPDQIDVDNPYEGIEFPLSAYLSSKLGLEGAEVNGIYSDSQGTIVRRCMARWGFEPMENEVPSAKAYASAGAPKIFGESTKNALEVLEAVDESIRSDAPSVASNPNRIAAIEDCYEKARSLANPQNGFYEWLTKATMDLSDRVAADKSIVNAEAEASKCIEKLGYHTGDPSEISSQLNEKVGEIISGYQSGSISLADARTRIGEVKIDEAKAAPTVLRCTYAKNRIRFQLRATLERAFIDRNVVALDEQIAVLRDSLADLPRLVDEIEPKNG